MATVGCNSFTRLAIVFYLVQVVRSLHVPFKTYDKCVQPTGAASFSTVANTGAALIAAAPTFSSFMGFDSSDLTRNGRTLLIASFAASLVALSCISPSYAIAFETSTEKNAYHHVSVSSSSETAAPLDIKRISFEKSVPSLIVASQSPDVIIVGISSSLTSSNAPSSSYSSSLSSSSSNSIIDEISGNRDSQSIIKSDLNRLKLCYAPQTKAIGKIFLSEISTVYSTIKGENNIKILNNNNGEMIGDSNNSDDDDDRININSVSSHLFFDNFLFGKHWINFSGKYDKISEILCRVVWEKVWVDINSDRKNGPSDIDKTENHVQPEFVQFIGKKIFFSNSENNPDLYSVYSPCIFR